MSESIIAQATAAIEAAIPGAKVTVGGGGMDDMDY